jgi:hypothetical protein
MNAVHDNAVREYVQNEATKYRLECLKQEISQIDGVIGRLETYSQNARNFAAVLWIGSLTILSGQDSLKPFVFATAIIPVLFWIIDARWIHLAKGPITKYQAISEFVNSGQLETAILSGSIEGFQVLDVMGRQHHSDQSYQRRTKMWRVLTYRTLYLYYGLMISISIMIALVL